MHTIQDVSVLIRNGLCRMLTSPATAPAGSTKVGPLSHVQAFQPTQYLYIARKAAVIQGICQGMEFSSECATRTRAFCGGVPRAGGCACLVPLSVG
jgi:hypothetical protein